MSDADFSHTTVNLGSHLCRQQCDFSGIIVQPWPKSPSGVVLVLLTAESDLLQFQSSLDLHVKSDQLLGAQLTRGGDRRINEQDLPPISVSLTPLYR